MTVSIITLVWLQQRTTAPPPPLLVYCPSLLRQFSNIIIQKLGVICTVAYTAGQLFHGLFKMSNVVTEAITLHLCKIMVWKD